MTGPRRIWIPASQVENQVDVSDGSFVKGPGTYYVRADVVNAMLDTLAKLKKILIAAIEKAGGGKDDA